MLQFLDVIRIRARRLLQCLGAALSVGPVRPTVGPSRREVAGVFYLYAL